MFLLLVRINYVFNGTFTLLINNILQYNSYLLLLKASSIPLNNAIAVTVYHVRHKTGFLCEFSRNGSKLFTKNSALFFYKRQQNFKFFV